MNKDILLKRSCERIKGCIKHFLLNVAENKITFTVSIIVTCVTLAVAVTTALYHQFESTFVAVLSLILYLVPTASEEVLSIKLPTALETVLLLFIFCANILGEIGEWYTRFAFLDDMLHGISGFLFAAVGISLIALFGRYETKEIAFSPIFAALIALCFAVTVGVVWEFFEFSCDILLHTDMQKDCIIESIHSAHLNTHGQAPKAIADIATTLVTSENGTYTAIDGYLDIGLWDTMQDLFIDFFGALVFCALFCFSKRFPTAKILAEQFIPQITPTSNQ